jgi:hypothetical protein
MEKPCEATIRVLAAAFQRIRADALGEVLSWPGGLFIAICIGLYIAATSLARGAGERRHAGMHARPSALH